jgi:error-prone DNA polymerase
LREEAAQAIVSERASRPFTSIEDLLRRAPTLRKSEAVVLGEIGALDWVGEGIALPRERGALPYHRRDALWQVERSSRPAGPLLENLESQISNLSSEAAELNSSSALPACQEITRMAHASPLRPMTREERLVADFRGTGLTVGPHPMAYRRAEMNALGARCAGDLRQVPNGKYVRIAGCVIARQRPGTAKGFVFLSLEDETGIANAIITPDIFERNRLTLVQEQFLLVEGKLQKQDGVISVKAERVRPLSITEAETRSHDFH